MNEWMNGITTIMCTAQLQPNADAGVMCKEHRPQINVNGVYKPKACPFGTVLRMKYLDSRTTGYYIMQHGPTQPDSCCTAYQHVSVKKSATA
jgi:hypothetical protein